MGLALTAWLTLTLQDYQNERLQTRFNTEVDRMADDIERRFNTVVQGLSGARGVYAASEAVSRAEFRRYVDSRNLSQEFPGLRGMGFIERVPRAGLGAFVARERADGAPDFSVRTQGDAADLYVIKFIEPLARNLAAQGLDVGAEPVRREAAERAARTGRPALSGVIQLVQDQLSRPGFLLYVPVYQPNRPLDTPAQRLAALHGLTYAAIVLEELLQPGRDLHLASELHLHLSDKPESAGGQSLFSVGPEHPNKVRLHDERAIVIAGLPLFLKAHSTQVFEASANQWLVLALGGAGVLLSTLLALVIWLQATGRARAEARAQRMTVDLQKLALVAQRTANSVLMTDAQLRITWVNEGFTRVTGYGADQAQGKTPAELLSSGKADPATLETLRLSAEQGMPCRVDILNRAKDGREYWIDTEVQPLRDEAGQLIGFIEIGLDITQERETNARLVQAVRASEALQQELDLLARVARETSNAVVLTDTEDRIEWVNAGFTRITGYTLDEVLGQKPGQFLQCAETDPATTIRIRAALDALQPCHEEILNRAKDGRLYWLELEIQPLFNPEGRHTGFMAIESDITTQKHAEIALRLSETRMKTLFELSVQWFWETDTELRFTQFTCGDPDLLTQLNTVALGRRRWEMDVEPLNTTWAEHQALMERREPFRDFEYRRVDPSGEVHYWSASGTPWYNAAGNFVGYIGTGADISKRRLQEDSLRTEEARMRAIYDILPVGVSITDPQGHIIDCNRASEQLLGISKAEHLARDYDGKEWVINREDGSPMPVDEFASVRALSQGSAVHDAVMQVITDRHSVWLSVSAMPVQHEDFGVVIAYVDITHQKMQADALLAAKTQAEQASLFKSQFLANMSHEIRTPMNAILGMLQLLQSTPLQPRQLDYVDKTEGAAKSLLGLLNDILDFSKVEAGKMTLDLQPFGLDKLLRDLAVIFSASVGNKPVEVLFDIDPQVPRRLVGDSLRLQQVLINLGGNAIKFTAQGAVVLRVRLEAMEGHGPEQRARLSFAVQDSGIGIAPDNQHKIFAGFTQAEASTTRRFGGTGLGLAICRRLIEVMGGQLRLQSTLGQGSTFSFSLTLPLGEQPAASAPWCIPGLAVLVVDDNPLARELMAAMGASMGWAVDVADSGESALEMIRTRAAHGMAYRAVLMDWLMPGLDGWQTSARIRELGAHAGEAGATPLIMMVTAHGREMLSQQTTEVQALIDGYLVKPVTASMLFDAMQNILQPAAVVSSTRVSTQVLRPLDGLRVLLVEDNAINQQVAEELLSAQGAAIDIADNGLRGVEAVQAAITSGKPYHAVLMDMQMPVMDGLSATREIRGRLGVADLPIIAMTANAMASDREACLEAGMNDHVGKPFDLARLIATLLQWVKGEADPVGVPALPAAGPADVPAPSAPALLNRDVALRRVGGSASLLDRLSTQFLGDLPGLLQACDAALDSSGHDKAQRALHTLKGVAATIGAEALAEAAARAERACKDGGAVDLDPVHTVAAQTRQSLLDQGVAPPAAASTVPTPAAQSPMTPAQRDILERLLPLLEGSEMAVFDTMGELLAQGDASRWALLDGAVQVMDFGQAADQVRQALEPT